MGAGVSAFRKLMDEAKALGMREVYFGVQLDKVTADDSREAWRAGCLDIPTGPCSAAGRTGEEAFRKLVEATRARKENA